MLRGRIGRSGNDAWQDDGDYEQKQEAGHYWDAQDAAPYKADEQADQQDDLLPGDGQATYYHEDDAPYAPPREDAGDDGEIDDAQIWAAAPDDDPSDERALALLDAAQVPTRRSAAGRALVRLSGERRELADFLEPRATAPMLIVGKRRPSRPGALGHAPLSIRAHRPRPFLMIVAVVALFALALTSVALAAAPLEVQNQLVNAFTSLAGYSAPASAAKVAYHWYQVHYGDSLQSIANRFGVQAGGILEMNGLQDGDQLYVGMRLKIPTDPAYGSTFETVVDIPPPPPDQSGNVFGTNPWNSLSGATDPQNICAPQGNADTQADRQAFQLIEANPGAIFARGFTWYHNGVDLDNPAGTPILAAQAGLVVFAGWDTLGLGWSVKINNCWGLSTMYGHMEHPPLVHAGDYVTVGQQVGQEGSTGNSTGPHLHFMTEWWNKPANPYCFDFQLPTGNTPCTSS